MRLLQFFIYVMPHDYTKNSAHTWILVFQDESQNTPSSPAALKQSTATKQSSAALVEKKCLPKLAVKRFAILQKPFNNTVRHMLAKLASLCYCKFILWRYVYNFLADFLNIIMGFHLVPWNVWIFLEPIISYNSYPFGLISQRA